MDVDVARFRQGVVDVAHIRCPDLVSGARLERHLALLMRTPLRFVQLVEVAVGFEDPANGSDAEMYAGLLQGRLHPERPELSGFSCKRLTASIALRSTFRTPFGLPRFLSSSPSGPSSTQRLTTL